MVSAVPYPALFITAHPGCAGLGRRAAFGRTPLPLHAIANVPAIQGYMESLMTTWKRWSWRYRMGALVALTMLLQGASCFRDMIPSFTVPGVQGAVTAQILHSPDGVPFYEVLARDDGKGTKYYRYVYPGDPEYDAIINFFRTHPDITVYDFSRPSIPGGAGTLPAPAVQ